MLINATIYINFPITCKATILSSLYVTYNIVPEETKFSFTCNFSSDSEFKTKSTPLPLVSFRIISSNVVSRELPMLESVRNKLHQKQTTHPRNK